MGRDPVDLIATGFIHRVVQKAVPRERSPSCGSSLIYDGTFQGVQIHGRGVTAALLVSEGITVYSEEQLTIELLESLFGTRAFLS